MSYYHLIAHERYCIAHMMRVKYSIRLIALDSTVQYH